MIEKKSWRDVLKVHPACELFSMMSESELRELGEDIREHGLQSEVVICRDRDDPNKFSLLDGRNRLDAMELVGIQFELVCDRRRNRRLYYCWFVPGEDVSVFDGLENPIKTIDDDIDPYKYVISANALRRHLTREQKRELIAKVLKASPEKSDRHIAQMIKADHKTVSAVRQQAEARGEIPHVTVRKDSRGRRTPAKRHAHGPRAAQKETNMAGAVHLEPERGVGLAAQPYDQLVAAWKVCCPDDQRRFLAHIGAKHQATRSRGLTATK